MFVYLIDLFINIFNWLISTSGGPYPALNMVGIWVYPCMLVVAVNSMMMWTLKGGILGKATIRILIKVLFQVLGCSQPWPSCSSST